MERVRISNGHYTVEDSVFTTPHTGVFGEIAVLLAPKRVRGGREIQLWAKDVPKTADQAYNITGLEFQMEDADGN